MSISRFFETVIRDDSTSFVIWRNDRPDWLRDAVYEAHDVDPPNDWRYEMCSRIADAIDDDPDAALGDPCEAVRDWADVYTSDLFSWYADNVSRIAYADKVLDLGFTLREPITDTLRVGQQLCIEEMAAVMVRAVEEAYNDADTDVPFAEWVAAL